MRYKGTKLLLENFRSVLSGYSVDIQDVVRSAILDDVDISDWIEKCSDNPYRLDQIRLGMKEEIDKGYFEYKSGEVLRGIRGLIARGINLSPILRYNKGELSDRCFLYLIVWCKEGINFSMYDFSIVPDYQLDFYDFALRRGINIKSFNSGRQYRADYIDECIKIIGNGCEIEKFASADYSMQIVDLMEKVSEKSRSRYMRLYCVLDKDTTFEELALLEKISSLGVTEVQTLRGIHDVKKLELVLKASSNGVRLEGVRERGVNELNESLLEILNDKNRILSGRIYHN